jgi:hypothetical protein
MKKYLKIVLLIIIVVSFGFWQIKTKNIASQVQNEKTVQKESATLNIKTGDDFQSFDISEFVGKTALSATESKSSVVTSGTGVNAYITSINGVEADAKKHEFWEFLVNGSQAQVGAGSYIIENGNEIQWKISNF